VYRIGFAAGVEEGPKLQTTSFKLDASIIREVLFLAGRTSSSPSTSCLLDIQRA